MARAVMIVGLLMSTLLPSITAMQEKQSANAARTQSSTEQPEHKGPEPASPAAPHADCSAARGSRPDVLVTVERGPSQPDSSGVGDWFHFILNLLLPWPLLVILLLLYLFLPTGAPLRIESLLRPFQSLKLFGQEFVLNPQGGRNAEAAIDFYRKDVQVKLDARVRKMKLKDKHEEVMKNYVAKLIPEFSSKSIR